jgi:uncharacterized damage-inducible protein DinB
MLETDELDFAGKPWTPLVVGSNAERLAVFDKNAAEMKSAVEAADWEAVSGSWTMRSGETVYLSDRKATLLRTLGLSHMAHHRAQLGVYLRQLEKKIPGCYGPSADEMGS